MDRTTRKNPRHGLSHPTTQILIFILNALEYAVEIRNKQTNKTVEEKEKLQCVTPLLLSRSPLFLRPHIDNDIDIDITLSHHRPPFFSIILSFFIQSSHQAPPSAAAAVKGASEGPTRDHQGYSSLSRGPSRRWYVYRSLQRSGGREKTTILNRKWNLKYLIF